RHRGPLPPRLGGDTGHDRGDRRQRGKPGDPAGAPAAGRGDRRRSALVDTYPSPGSFGPTGRVAPPLPRRTSIVLRPRFPWRKLAWLGGVLVVLCLLALGTGYRYTEVSPGTVAVSVPPVDAGDRKVVRKIQSTHKQLQGKLAASAPRGTYIV